MGEGEGETRAKSARLVEGPIQPNSRASHLGKWRRLPIIRCLAKIRKRRKRVSSEPYMRASTRGRMAFIRHYGTLAGSQFQHTLVIQDNRGSSWFHPRGWGWSISNRPTTGTGWPPPNQPNPCERWTPQSRDPWPATAPGLAPGRVAYLRHVPTMDA